MQENIKCPNCGGNQFNEIGNSTYKCKYCGNVFTYRKTEEMPSHTPVGSSSEQSHIIANVNNGNTNERQAYNRSYSTQSYRREKSRTTAAILAIVIGDFGIHHFNLRNTGLGMLYLIFFWTWIPAIIAFIEGIVYLCMSDEEFDRKYNNR